MRLDAERDKVDGIAWMIPLGDTLSVGISVDNDRFSQSEVEKRELRQRLDEAFTRRGVDYRYFYPEHKKETMEIVHRYYRRDRAHGANWVLAGGSYISIWFPSGAGLWTTLAVSRMAKLLIEEPLKYGPEYQEMMTEPLLRFHELLEGMARGPLFCDNRQVFRFWSQWLAGIPLRLADFLSLETDAMNTNRFDWLRRFSRTMIRHSLLQLFCWGFPVIRLRNPDQLGDQADSFSGYYNEQGFTRKMRFGVRCSTWVSTIIVEQLSRNCSRRAKRDARSGEQPMVHLGKRFADTKPF